MEHRLNLIRYLWGASPSIQAPVCHLQNNAAINCNPGPPLPRGSGDLPGDSILYFLTSKVQPWVLSGTAGGIFLVNPQVGPHPITPGTFVQSHGICE